MARSTKEEALETRGRILDAAAEVFHQNGVSRTTLADVAAAADVTRGAIYWHFKNKSDLFDAMCERVRLPMEAMIEKAADENAYDPLNQFRNRCLFALQEATLNSQSRKVFEIVFHKCELVDPEDPIFIRQHECFLQGRTDVERLLRFAVAKGQLPRELDPVLAAVMVQGLLVGILSNWTFSPHSFDLAEHASKVVDNCIHMFKTSPFMLKNNEV
ncbi:TetR family transcriptional regulator [Collimonas antrihumi]|uniref:TetR family transcriptional regulator n=1 Tax=Collimonas antrihumi TaxID=1940615 RepID=UPI001B8B0B3C|nr:TetR family transcriptional regulator [Collimonas antrihumi]